MAQYYGAMLGTAWHYILATMQVLISLLELHQRAGVKGAVPRLLAVWWWMKKG